MRVTDPESGRTIEMYTTEPAVQFYGGNFLKRTLKGKEGLTYAHWGVTIEAQHYPDSAQSRGFSEHGAQQAGEKYTQTTVYKFLPL